MSHWGGTCVTLGGTCVTLRWYLCDTGMVLVPHWVVLVSHWGGTCVTRALGGTFATLRWHTCYTWVAMENKNYNVQFHYTNYV